MGQTRAGSAIAAESTIAGPSASQGWRVGSAAAVSARRARRPDRRAACRRPPGWG